VSEKQLPPTILKPGKPDQQCDCSYAYLPRQSGYGGKMPFFFAKLRNSHRHTPWKIIPKIALFREKSLFYRGGYVDKTQFPVGTAQ
jgi:hypothetical protein